MKLQPFQSNMVNYVVQNLELFLCLRQPLVLAAILKQVDSKTQSVVDVNSQLLSESLNKTVIHGNFGNMADKHTHEDKGKNIIALPLLAKSDKNERLDIKHHKLYQKSRHADKTL